MFPLLNQPTRITNHSAMSIDNIVSNAYGISHNTGIHVNDISDNLPIFTIEEEKLVICKERERYIYIYITK